MGLHDLSGEHPAPPIFHVQHHRAHAANAFYLSPFEEAAVLTCDFRGEAECQTFGLGKGNRLEIFDSQDFPHSLGVFYSTLTELLGYRPDADEWKVMAMAGQDVDCHSYLERLKSTVQLMDGGKFELDQSYYKAALVDQPRLYTAKLEQLLEKPEALADQELTDWHFKVAKAMQSLAEQICLHSLKFLFEKTRCKNLVVAGGFFLNSVFNGKILSRTPFDSLYIPFAPGDEGNSIGSALFVAHHLKHQQRDYSTSRTPLLGPNFSTHSVERSLHQRKIPYTQWKEPAEIAELLAKRKVIAFFQGKMECGERALGNRSILADPRDTEVREIINRAIKFRELFRPFGPIVMQDRAEKYFEVSPNWISPYMEKVVPVRTAFRNQLPAITHVDGTARVQTLTRDDNPLLYKVLKEFELLTGFGLLLNTSFNINEEPIVCTPDDALTTFFKSGLEVLVLQHTIVLKTL